jgi:hypothetical protein
MALRLPTILGAFAMSTVLFVGIARALNAAHAGMRRRLESGLSASSQLSELVVASGFHAAVASTLLPLWVAPPRALAHGYHGFDPRVDLVGHTLVGFELWCCAVELARPASWVQLTMLAHHVVTAGVVLLCVDPPFLHAKACYYFGATSLCNVFINARALFDHFPKLRRTHPRALVLARVARRVVFVLTRFVGWFAVTLPLLYDLLGPTATPAPDGDAPSPSHPRTCAACLAVLSAMQATWTCMLVCRRRGGGSGAKTAQRVAPHHLAAAV